MEYEMKYCLNVTNFYGKWVNVCDVTKLCDVGLMEVFGE